MYCHPLGDQYVMPKSQMKCGRLCAAKFAEDDRWHRGTIKGFSGDMVEVLTSKIQHFSLYALEVKSVFSDLARMQVSFIF